jgi:hypothetical protein
MGAAGDNRGKMEQGIFIEIYGVQSWLMYILGVL